MRVKDKKNIRELLGNMHRLHGLLTRVEPQLRNDFLNSSQEAAIVLGTFLEKDAQTQEGNPEVVEARKEIVHVLEDYCEALFQLSQETESGGITDAVKGLDRLLEKVRGAVEQLRVSYRAVFFPYKAEMWDSLESIYLAARKDPLCEALVVPIPYYEKNAQTGQWEARYDGGRFPEELSAVSYADYDYREEQPDVAYVHYPYDDHNYVTTVHPDYYSRVLKKFVRKLVYVPYYVTDGHMSEEHLNLPVYHSMDYAVLQSKQMKENCRGFFYYDKLLVLGSPKLDRIINRSREGVTVPEEWREILQGRPSLMLNSSINDLLGADVRALKKLEYVFSYFEKHREVALIWRPHPLYESTMRSMRPHLLPLYQRLRQEYIDRKIGVYDETPEIAETVAIADGYIGSGASSVINLFGAAGKPIFIFDNNILGEIAEEERRCLRFNYLWNIGDRYYAYTPQINELFAFELPEAGEEATLSLQGKVSGQEVFRNAFLRWSE